MIPAWRIEVRDRSERLDGASALGGQGQWRMKEQTSIAKAKNRHGGSQPRAENTRRPNLDPDAFCERNHGER